MRSKLFSWVVVLFISAMAVEGWAQGKVKIRSLIEVKAPPTGETGIAIELQNYERDWQEVEISLCIYNKDKKEIARSGRCKSLRLPWIEPSERGNIVFVQPSMGRKRGEGLRYFFKIKGMAIGKIYLCFKSDFQELYGEPRYYKVELKINGELVDVLTHPKTLLQELEKSR